MVIGIRFETLEFVDFGIPNVIWDLTWNPCLQQSLSRGSQVPLA